MTTVKTDKETKLNKSKKVTDKKSKTVKLETKAAVKTSKPKNSAIKKVQKSSTTDKNIVKKTADKKTVVKKVFGKKTSVKTAEVKTVKLPIHKSTKPPKSPEKLNKGKVQEELVNQKEAEEHLENNVETGNEIREEKKENLEKGMIEETKADETASLPATEAEQSGTTDKLTTVLSGEEAEKKQLGTVIINELTTAKELSVQMIKVSPNDIIKKLLQMGVLLTINQKIDKDTAEIISNEFGYISKFVSINEESEIILNTNSQSENEKSLKLRPPVVTIMGHVDHGKTSLLDAIRDSDIAGGEHGGITQHIGAYKVKTPNGKLITFLDTPGHEAFTAMRSRGSQATDIVILVVSAADGVMPQTIEAINHAKAADVPIIVAVNKIDLPASNPEKIRQTLGGYGLISEEWGGDTGMIDISAKQKLNIDKLLDRVLLQAEIMELKANPDRKAQGIVIESKLDSKRGTAVTLLVQKGTLKIGDILVAGSTYGKVRAMIDDAGKRFNFAGPSVPVEILGMSEPPDAGDKFVVIEKEIQAREISNSRKERIKAASFRPKKHHLSLLDVSLGKVKELKIILKADVQGSLGALKDSLERLSTNEISLKIMHDGAGAITESDISLAAASDALIVGFNLRPDSSVEKLAESKGVSINVYRIIYDLIEDIKMAMEGLLSPTFKEKIIGKAVVKQVFKLSSFGTISGCSVLEGKIQRNSKVRLLRDNIIVFEGKITSLKRFKDDVKEVEKGYECGIGIENFSDIKSGDIVESFMNEEIARKLDS